ncbi:hypothetical protein CLOM621_06718 [Clostridium sp. M62/1]|nr:hypothetical protein CLOM621_06718 [Clostridium sp. M62/1]
MAENGRKSIYSTGKTKRAAPIGRRPVFYITGNFVPRYIKTLRGDRTAAKRKNAAFATRRRRRILQSRILSCLTGNFVPRYIKTLRGDRTAAKRKNAAFATRRRWKTPARNLSLWRQREKNKSFALQKRFTMLL